jgi:hypothetical protein
MPACNGVTETRHGQVLRAQELVHQQGQQRTTLGRVDRLDTLQCLLHQRRLQHTHNNALIHQRRLQHTHNNALIHQRRLQHTQ